MIDVKKTLTGGGHCSLKRIGTTVSLTITCQDESEAATLFGTMMQSMRNEGVLNMKFEELADQRYQGEPLQ
jgi:hypothetical protein